MKGEEYASISRVRDSSVRIKRLNKKIQEIYFSIFLQMK